MDLMDYRRKIIMSSPHLSHAEGAVATFSDGADLLLNSLLVNIDPVQSGTGDPSPDNVRPISGWSAVGVHDTGINLWDEQWEVGSIDPNTGGNYPQSDRIRSSGYIPVRPNTGYSHNISMYVYQYDADKNFLAPRSDCYTGTFTTRPETRYIRFITYSTYGTVYKHDISINYPSTDHDYHAYTGQSITIQWSRINVWDEEWETGNISGQDGTTLNDSSRVRSKNFSPCTPSTSYYKGNVNIFWYGANKEYLSYNTASSSNTVTSPSNAYYFKIATLTSYGGTYNHDISINYPSTDTNYHPYNGNYLHINQWDEVWETGTLNASGEPQAADNCIRSKNFCPIVGGQQYYLYTSKTDGGSQNRYYTKVVFYDANKDFISGSYENRRVFTAPSNAAYFKIHTNSSTVVYGGTYNYDISINYPATDTSYHPYNEFIVYGGTLNPLTGVMTVDMAMVDLGTLAWFYISQSGKERFYSSGIKNLVKKPAANTDNANIISSAYETFNVTHAFEKDKIIAIYTDGDIFIRDTSYTDTASLKTALSGVQLVYELAEPITYTLDPQTVRSLAGQNNIFADTGNVALEYWAHP